MGWLTGFLLKRGVSAGIVGWIGPALYVAAAIVIFSSGWFVRDKICDAARLKLENQQLKDELAFLREQNRKADEAAKKDAAQAEEDAIAIADLDARIRELTDGVEAGGVCLDAGSVDRLRKFWGKKD